MDELADPISFVSHAGHAIEITGLLNESYVVCEVDGELTSRSFNTLPRAVREELNAKTNRGSHSMATDTKTQSTKGSAAPAPKVDTEAEREARRVERENARMAKLEEKMRAIHETILEGIRDEENGFVAVTRESLEALKPTAEIAAMLKAEHGLTYGRLEGKGAWRLPLDTK